jgi:hypothetical protein
MKTLLFLFLTFSGASLAWAQATVEIAGLQFTPPKTWVKQAPASSMRAAQWGVPAAKKTEASGEVVAFYFGPGQGGDTKANMDRWLSTMTTPQGTPAQGDITVRQLGSLQVTQLLVFGTYANSMASPGIPPKPLANWGLAGAIIDRAEGAIFFRLTGPEVLVKAQLVPFTKFVDSLKPL